MIQHELHLPITFCLIQPACMRLESKAIMLRPKPASHLPNVQSVPCSGISIHKNLSSNADTSHMSLSHTTMKPLTQRKFCGHLGCQHLAALCQLQHKLNSSPFSLRIHTHGCHALHASSRTGHNQHPAKCRRLTVAYQHHPSKGIRP